MGAPLGVHGLDDVGRGGGALTGVADETTDLERRVIWREGAPPPDEVAAHVAACPVRYKGLRLAGLWLQRDEPEQGDVRLAIRTLRMALSGERVLAADETGHTTGFVDATGHVLTPTGFANEWILLDRCVWAPRSRWTPVSAMGFPVRLRPAEATSEPAPKTMTGRDATILGTLMRTSPSSPNRPRLEADLSPDGLVMWQRYRHSECTCGASSFMDAHQFYCPCFGR